MKKLVSIVADCVMVAAMLYAVVIISAVPAAACTPSQCSNLGLIAPSVCNRLYGCPTGHVVTCNGSGYVIECTNQSGGFCGSLSGQCQ
jgi:hypothetical protein